MQIRTIIREDCPELELHVCKNVLDGEVKSMAAALHELLDDKLAASDEYGNRVYLKPGDVVSIYAAGSKLCALTAKEQYTVSGKLYELESELEGAGFTRISKSELINVRMIRCLDMSVTGTIRLIMKNGYETYTSRRNVAKIKKLLVKGNEK